MFEIVQNDRDLWSAIVNLFDDGDVYHSYDYHSMCCVAQQAQDAQLIHLQHGNAHAALPILRHRVADSPEPTFDLRSVYGYPSALFSSGWTRHDLQDCWGDLVDTLSSQRVISLTSRISPFSEDAGLLSSIGTITPVGDIVVMPAKQASTEPPLKYRSNHRRDIRSLQKQGIQCRQVHSQKHIDAFAVLYRAQMQSAGASDMYSFDQRYFDTLNAARDFDCRLYACFDASQVICAGYFLFGKNNAHYHLGATSDTHRHMAPSKLLFHTVYQDCLREAVQTLNLGGGVGGSDDSLLRFKAGFSTLRLPFRMFHSTINADLQDAETAARECEALSHGLILDDHYVPRYRAPMKSPERGN